MKFSIITPLYNKERYFPETAHSVLEQTLGDWEWIIIDDGSTDNGLALALGFANEDTRIKVFTQENSGPCTARNRGIDKAKGEWILFLDADDLLETNCLSGWADLISENPELDLHAGCWLEMDAEAQTIIGTHQPVGFGKTNPMAVLRDSAIALAPWHPAASVVKRQLLSADYRWPEEMNRLVTEDTVFWWRLISRHQAAIHDHCGVHYRRGTPGCRDQFRDPVKWSQGLFRALDMNTAFLLSLEDRLSAGQVLNLCRVYEAFGKSAELAGVDYISSEAFCRADKALKHYGYTLIPSILLRRVLGVRRFSSMRS